MPGGVELVGAGGVEPFDHAVVATHSDQALSHVVGSRPGGSEPSSVPSATNPTGPPFTPTPGCLPRHRRAWASWNYHRLRPDADQATLTYHLNQLQGIPSTTPVLVTLNQDEAIDPERVLARMDYAHPVLDPVAVGAQRRHGEINGARRTWFCGAYWGYGFHEDGVRSAVETCRALGVTL